jgi:hypothetical protein
MIAVGACSCLPFFHVSALRHGASILPVACCVWHLMAVFCMCLVAYFFAPQWASFHQYTRTRCFSPYIGPHCDPVLARMKSHCVYTSSCGWGVALALFVLVQRGMVWAGCHALRLSLMPSGGCLVAQCNNSSTKKKKKKKKKPGQGHSGGRCRERNKVYECTGGRRPTVGQKSMQPNTCKTRP